MRKEPDVAVIGAGIAGLCVALELSGRGCRVTVVDERRSGSATRASAGMLAAGFGFASGIAACALEARELYPRFVDRLHDGSGIRVPLDRRGIIELPTDDDDLARLHDAAPSTAERLEAVDLAALDPLLARHGGGLLHPCDGAVDNGRLLDALVRCAERDPRIALVEHTVVSVALDPSEVRVVLADGSSISVDRLVVAGGAWAGQLRGLPRPLPVRPVRGELLLLDGEMPRHVVHGRGGYLVPRAEGLLVGATSEEDGFVVRTTSAGEAALLRIAGDIAGLGASPILRHWAGLRPMSPDGMPILGPDPDDGRVHYAAGLSRNGILFAPWAAAKVAAAVDGGGAAALAPFSIARFGSAGAE